MKVLVHLHIYYYDQMIYFLYKLSNISGCDWELFITEARHDPEIEKVFCRLGTRVHYIETGNRGYDIWPFIKVMKSVDLDEYDLVMKLHTKNRRNGYEKINGVKLSGYQWRNELVDSLLKNKKHFRWLMDTFRKNDRLGLMCSDWMYKKISKSLPEDATMLDAELERLGFKINNENFCAGTMFIARAGLYKFLQSDMISEDIFSTEARTGSDGSMAHVYERILSMVPSQYSYTVKTVVTDRRRSCYIRIKEYSQPVMNWLFSITRIGENRHKYLTVLGVRIRLTGRMKRKSGIQTDKRHSPKD